MNISPIKLLYVEDDEVDRRAFARLVREKALPWTVAYAETIAQARAMLASARYDVVVAGYDLPDGNSSELFETVVETPFVVLTGTPEEQLALRTLERGADDYLIKEPERRYMDALPFTIEKTLRRKHIRDRERELTRQVRENEQELRATVENAASGIARTDVQDRLVAVNDRLCQMLGYSREQLLGMSVHELTYPEDRPRSRAANQELREGRVSVVHYEKRFLKRDGTPLWAHVAISGVRDQEGRYCYSIGTTVDISAQKAAEEEARLHAAALAAAPNGISLSKTDPGGTIVWVNQAFTRLTGYEPGEVVGQTHHILSSGLQDDRFYRGLWETIMRGEVWRGELINRRKDGALYYEEMGITPLRDAEGKVTHYVAIKQDITERKRAEIELAEQAQRLRLATEAARLGVFDWNVESDSSNWENPRMYEIFGIAPGSTPLGCRELGRTVLHPEDVEQFERQLGHSQRSNATFEGEYRIRRRNDQQWRWVQCYAKFEPGHGEQAGRLVGVIADVTDRKQAEDRLRESQDALRSANARLKEADQRKDQFLAMLSHELRNPLAPIRNSLFLLARSVPGGEQAKRAEGVIERQTDHLTRLVDDLLNLTRITRGKVELRPERLDLVDIVRRVVEDHRSGIVDSGVELQTLIPETPVWMSGDRTRLTQIIGNIVTNAGKFTPRGGRIMVSVEADQPETAVVRVRDTGMGISAEMLPRIFEPFIQAAENSNSLGGLGLGLALVKGFVEMHGGTVEAASDGLGKGAEFSVHLPRREATKPEDVRAAEPAASITNHEQRVLVIEDNEDAAESLREVLELNERSVEVAHSGFEGIEKARRSRPEVVLCDIGLPGMDGYEVARVFRGDPALCGTRLVALTGYGAPEDVARARAAGFDAHLTKPASFERLDDAVSSPKTRWAFEGR